MSDVDEERFGSDALDASSTPENVDYDAATCSDGVDNDGDGSVDAADSGCGVAGLPPTGGEQPSSGVAWIAIVVAALIAMAGGLMLARQGGRSR